MEEILKHLPVDDVAKLDPMNTAIAVVSVVVWLYMVFLPSRILEKKGHGIVKRFLFTILGLALLWPITLVLALKAKDKNKVELPPKRKLSIGGSLNLKQSQAGFKKCSRCGQQNSDDLKECWNCQQEFTEDETPDTGKVAIPAKITVPGKPATATKVTMPEDNTAMGRTAKQMSDETQKLPNRPAKPPAGGMQLAEDVKFKVRCLDCQKTFNGTAAKLAKVRACPRCKSAPFRYEMI